MELKPYPKYKPSGIDWIGDIPEHWDVKRLKFISRINPSKSKDKLQANDEVVFLPMENIYENGTYDSSNRKLVSEVASGFTYFEEGDILVAKITPCFENGKGTLVSNLDTKVGFGSTEFHVLRASEDINTKFLFYITRTHSFMQFGEAFMTGAAGQKRVPTSFVENYLISIPPLKEQTSIANFLDKKTAQIDKLIEQKQKLIELLKAERTAIINKAVTKGIDPNAKLKPSGVEWLSDIPEHWEVKKLKYLSTKVGSGITPTGGANVYLEDGVPFLRSQNIYSEGLDLGDLVYISEEIDSKMSNSRIEEGDVLLNITGASIGRCSFVPKGFGRGNVNQHVCIIRPNFELVVTEFLQLVIASEYGQTLIDAFQSGANREGLNFQQIKSFEIPIPSIEDQNKIVLNIYDQLKTIDVTISKIVSEMDLLHEYRTTLISELVTGKIKISEL